MPKRPGQPAGDAPAEEAAVLEALRRLQEGAATHLTLVPRAGSVGGDVEEVLGKFADPFTALYQGHAGTAEHREAVEAAHDLGKWAGLRKAERAAAVAASEAAEDEWVAKRDSGADPGDVARAEARVRRARAAEDAASVAYDRAGNLRKAEELRSNALQVEDDRSGLVEVVSRNFVLEPTYHPAILEALVHHNSVLLPLVQAMEVNVPGTGWEIVPADTQAAEDELEGPPEGAGPEVLAQHEADVQAAADALEADIQRRLEKVEGFYKQPWPGMSWTTARRKLRRDLHSGGNAYLEVVRDSRGDVAAARPIDHKLMRLVRLGEPVLVTKKFRRGAEDVEFPTWVRERRFVQQVGGGASLPHSDFQQSVGSDPSTPGSAVDAGRLLTGQGLRVNYFREFGSGRELDKFTGQWAKDGEVIPVERRATEVIHLVDQPDPNTPYGVPRWISVLPSVLGMRRAEEHNLSYFRAGGIPPLLIMVLGGIMGERAKAELVEMLNGQNPASKHQAAILEMVPGGRIDQANKVDVKVESFGSARAEDAMFLQYDERTAKRVRESFRLPPLFAGDVAAHNFSTAKLAVMTAEAQVFTPERQEEDEALSNRILRELPDGENFEFRSLPLIVDDAALQEKILELSVKEGLVSGEDAVDAANKIGNLGLRYDSDGHRQAKDSRSAMADALLSRGAPAGMGQGAGDQAGAEAGQGDGATADELGIDKADVSGLAALGVELFEAVSGDPGTPLDGVLAELAKLSPRAREVVRDAASAAAYGRDREDLARLLGCAVRVSSLSG